MRRHGSCTPTLSRGLIEAASIMPGKLYIARHDTWRKAKQRMTHFLEVLQRERVVVVIRSAESATLGQELRALYEGGLRVFEVTFEAPGAIDAFSSVREQLPDDALLGAGTVLDPGTASLVV